MKSTIKLIVLLIINAFGTSQLFSQTAVIENVQYYFEKTSKQIVITYDISNYEEDNTFNIELLFIDGKNQKIEPKSVTGDIGINIKGGKNKKINWDLYNDISELSETAKPILKITSVIPPPVDASHAIYIEEIRKPEKSSYTFKFKREGVGLIGICSGILCLPLKINGDKYIEQQKQSKNLDEYWDCRDNANTLYTLTWVSGGISAVCIGYAVYQYIWGDKTKHDKHAFLIVPNSYNGASLAFKYNF